MISSTRAFDPTRRFLLQSGIAGTALALGGCCPFPRQPASTGTAVLTPPTHGPLFARAAACAKTASIVDAHAHFFNAADVPVRGFVAECVGHRLPEPLQPLIEVLAYIAERLARAAPTAAEELLEIEGWHANASAFAEPQREAWLRSRIARLRSDAAERLAEAIAGSEFERRLRAAYGLPAAVRGRGSPTFSPGEVLARVEARESPSETPPAAAADPRVAAADGALAFVYYMLSHRGANLDTYRRAFTCHPNAAGVETVIGALVDFDYWLRCPPRSSQDDQVRLHAVLSRTWGGYMRPLVAYNPWTDIEEAGAAKRRVTNAVENLGFVGVKIYPPMGFYPAENAGTSLDSRKRRPSLSALDGVLGDFFDECARLGVPVLSHTSASNGRDDAHDALGGPAGWSRLLHRYAGATRVPIISFGHFGGDGTGTQSNDWTHEFAALMQAHPNARLYADIGYWDGLNCRDPSAAKCSRSWARLRAELQQPIGTAATVSDRVMFGTDWLMLAMVDDWAKYPARLRAGFGAETAKRVLDANARTCFQLPTSS